MSEERWNEPIEPMAPIPIDVDGLVVIGTYLGSSDVQLRESKRDSKIHSVVLEGETAMPTGETLPAKTEFRFWGSYDLDEKLRRVPIRRTVRIVYVGKEELPGEREMKRFEVRVAKAV